MYMYAAAWQEVILNNRCPEVGISGYTTTYELGYNSCKFTFKQKCPQDPSLKHLDIMLRDILLTRIPLTKELLNFNYTLKWSTNIDGVHLNFLHY